MNTAPRKSEIRSTKFETNDKQQEARRCGAMFRHPIAMTVGYALLPFRMLFRTSDFEIRISASAQTERY